MSLRSYFFPFIFNSFNISRQFRFSVSYHVYSSFEVICQISRFSSYQGFQFFTFQSNFMFSISCSFVSMSSFNMVVSMCRFSMGFSIHFHFNISSLVWFGCVFGFYMCVFMFVCSFVWFFGYIIYIHVFVCGMYMAILLPGAESEYFLDHLYSEPNCGDLRIMARRE